MSCWREQLQDSLGKEPLDELWQLVLNTWDSLRVDVALASNGNMSVEEGLLVCHFSDHASKARTCPENSVAVVTPHYANMVWLRHCVDVFGKCLCGGQYPILLKVATLDWSQGLQVQVMSASLVSHVPEIMTIMCRANTLTKRTQLELHLFGRLAQWGEHPTPRRMDSYTE